MGDRYRVLALDGGGSWALVQAQALGRLYGKHMRGRELLAQFDLVASNSGGSIVLGCLVENMTPAQILDFFMDEKMRRRIFSPTHDPLYWALHKLTGVGPKYSADEKLAGLQSVLTHYGQVTVSDSIRGCPAQSGEGDVRLLIVGFDYDRCHATFFRSAKSGGPQLGNGQVAQVSLAEAIHASTNAPVNYFDGPAHVAGTYRFWDGGITGCNNPVLVGVTEAIAARTDTSRQIVALSIGTGTVARPGRLPDEPDSPFYRQPSETGLLHDVRKLAGAILDDPPDMASFLAHLMTGRGAGLPEDGIATSWVVRMNPMIRPVRDENGGWKAPADMSLESFNALAALDMDAVAQSDVDKIYRYARLWLREHPAHRINQPMRMDGDTLECELGYETFAAAKAAWEAISG